jgi:hypothetical protein
MLVMPILYARPTSSRLCLACYALTLPPTLRDAVIAVVQERIQRPTNGQGHDRAKLTAQLERPRDLYQLGDLDKATYLQRRAQLQQQLGQATPAPQRTLDIERAIELLSSMAALLDATTDTAQQRALIQQVLITIWVQKGALVAVRPAPNYVLLMQAAPMWLKRPRRARPHNLRSILTEKSVLILVSHLVPRWTSDLRQLGFVVVICEDVRRREHAIRVIGRMDHHPIPGIEANVCNRPGGAPVRICTSK